MKLQVIKFLLAPVLFLSLSLASHAIGVDKDRLADPVQEEKAQYIMKQLRCLVCQNQSIVESDAELAQDLRAIVREQVRAGKSHGEILEFMTARYGDWVLLMPPFKGTTALLWLGPFILLLVGSFLVMGYVRRRPEDVRSKPLTAAEEKRLKEIMKDGN